MYCEFKKNQEIHQAAAQPFKQQGPQEGIFKLIFADGKYKEYSVKELQKFDFFKGIYDRFSESKKKEVKFENIRSDVFDIATGLSIRNQHITQLVSENEELRHHPELFEIIRHALQFLNPGNNDNLLEDLKEKQLTHITCEEAKAILQNYELGKYDYTPVWVGIAKILLLSQIYFETENEFQAWTEKAALLEKDSWALESKLHCHKVKYHNENLSKIEKSLELAAVESLMVYKLKKIRLTCFWHSTKDTLPMICHQRASEKKSEEPEVKNMIESSKQILSNYKRKYQLALKESGANMTRSDLLEHLVGPKNFLFDHYGLKLDGNNEQNHYIFIHPLVTEGRFGYSLDNNSPFALESEIRSDLKRYLGDDLPARVIQIDEVTRHVTPKVKELREFFMEKLVHWHSLEDEVKNETVQKLIECSGWNRLNLNPADVSFSDFHVHLDHEVTGKLTLKTITFDIFFNTFDFIVCLIDDRGTRTNQFGTLSVLRIILN